jgi:hypothetical protein
MTAPVSQCSAEQAFALLETACEDFENLQDIVRTPSGRRIFSQFGDSGRWWG